MIRQVPDWIKEKISAFHPKWSTQKKTIMAHIKRELFHAVWTFLLDDDFKHAYTYGILIQCSDGVIRRVYPRFFIYSADYPEKYIAS
jgi:hypothetical protein